MLLHNGGNTLCQMNNFATHVGRLKKEPLGAVIINHYCSQILKRSRYYNNWQKIDITITAMAKPSADFFSAGVFVATVSEFHVCMPEYQDLSLPRQH